MSNHNFIKRLTTPSPNLIVDVWEGREGGDCPPETLLARDKEKRSAYNHNIIIAWLLRDYRKIIAGLP